MILMFHIASALSIALLGAMQIFTPKSYHRIAGYGFAACAVFTSFSGISLALTVPNIFIKASLLWGGIYLTYRTGRAIQYARTKQIALHVAQIITIYGLIISALTVRIGILLLTPFLPPPYSTLLPLWLVTIGTLYLTRKILQPRLRLALDGGGALGL